MPGYENLTKKEAFLLVKEKAEELNAIDRLLGFSSVMDHVLSDKRRVGRPKSGYYLLKLDFDEKSITVQSFTRDETERANFAYEALEKEAITNPRIDSVLVSVGPFDELRKAYPNYFLDVREFVVKLRSIIAQADTI